MAKYSVTYACGLADLFRDKEFSRAWDVCNGGEE